MPCSAPVTRSTAWTMALSVTTSVVHWHSTSIRFFVQQDATSNPLTYAPEKYQQRVRHVSELMDSTNPDLSAFQRRGGKLILKEHGADYAQSPYEGIQYYKSVVTRLGQPMVDSF